MKPLSIAFATTSLWLIVIYWVGSLLEIFGIPFPSGDVLILAGGTIFAVSFFLSKYKRNE